ncbi:MAG: hypothetical protein HYY29_01275 [Chloroflexi bacterium]|nr:hypothetical protein [Chloroflexota bacterium]
MRFVISYLVLGLALFTSTSAVAYAVGLQVQKTVPASVVVPQPVPAIPGDLDGNGLVNVADLGLVVSNFNSAPPGNLPADINKDGMVDIYDLVSVGINFGRTRD